MAWFLFLLAMAALAPAFFTTSLALGIGCMLASLALTILATMSMLAAQSLSRRDR